MNFRTLATILAVGCLFSTGFKFKGEPFDLYLYYLLLPIVIAAAVFNGARPSNRFILILIASLVVHSAVSVAFLSNSAMAAMQQVVGISAMATLYYMVFQINDDDVGAIFSIYVKLSALVSLVAILQVLSFHIGLTPGYDFSGWIPDFNLQFSDSGGIRAQSVFSEPSHFAGAISGAIFIAIHNLTSRSTIFISRPTSLLIAAAAVLSFSTMAFLAILASFALLALNGGFVRRWSMVVACSVAGVLAYAMIPEIRIRIDDTVSLFLHHDMQGKNLSALSLYNNGYVALQNLKESYLFGGGLGSHPLAFQEHSLLYSDSSLPVWLAVLNAQDANSLLLRIVSELGILGLGAAILFLFGLYVLKRRSAWLESDGRSVELGYWIISNAALVFFIVALVRSGHYFAFGAPFFAFVYLIAWRWNRVHLHAGRAARAEPARTTSSTWVSGSAASLLDSSRT